MAFIWDYNREELGKTEAGRILLLERMVNFGPEEGEKIPLTEVKKYWNKITLFPNNKRLMELLIWGKVLS